MPQQSGFPGTVLPETGKRGVLRDPGHPCPHPPSHAAGTSRNAAVGVVVLVVPRHQREGWMGMAWQQGSSARIWGCRWTEAGADPRGSGCLRKETEDAGVSGERRVWSECSRTERRKHEGNLRNNKERTCCSSAGGGGPYGAAVCFFPAFLGCFSQGCACRRS